VRNVYTRNKKEGMRMPTRLKQFLSVMKKGRQYCSNRAESLSGRSTWVVFLDNKVFFSHSSWISAIVLINKLISCTLKILHKYKLQKDISPLEYRILSEVNTTSFWLTTSLAKQSTIKIPAEIILIITQESASMANYTWSNDFMQYPSSSIIFINVHYEKIICE